MPSSEILQDRAYMSEMKSNILQRAEAAAYEDDDDNDNNGGSHAEPKGRDVAFEEEDIDEGSVIHVGDGNDSEEDGDTSVDGDREDGDGTVSVLFKSLHANS